MTGKGFQLSGIDACLKKPANWAERLFMLGPNVSTSSRFAASVCIVHFSLYVELCITEIHRAVSQIRNNLNRVLDLFLVLDYELNKYDCMKKKRKIVKASQFKKTGVDFFCDS